MATFINATLPYTAHVRIGPGKSHPFVPSKEWANGEAVERVGNLVKDGSYDLQYCIRVKNRNEKGYIRNDFLVDR